MQHHMKVLRMFLIVGGLSFVASCATHAPCPGLGGENIDKEKMEIPTNASEVESEEGKA